jgi:hypothetical protein
MSSTAKDAPTFIIPSKDSEDPKRAKLLNDKEEPRLETASTDMDAPTREKDRSDKEEPK